MGGYGAMMFSNLLRLDATLTLSPQYSIQPEKVQGDSRWAHIASELDFVFDDMNIGMSATARHNLFYDPCTADNIHAQLFEKKAQTALHSLIQGTQALDFCNKSACYQRLSSSQPKTREQISHLFIA